MVRLDMSECMEKHSVSRLIGAPRAMSAMTRAARSPGVRKHDAELLGISVDGVRAVFVLDRQGTGVEICLRSRSIPAAGPFSHTRTLARPSFEVQQRHNTEMDNVRQLAHA
jgi:hypothetical protein